MAHQKKELKKFTAIKDDFRKLLKNLKELDNDRKRLSRENDMLQNFIKTGLQRSNHSEHSSTVHRQEKGHAKTIQSPKSLDSVLSKYTGNLNSSNSHPHAQQRVSVIPSPTNGKLGIIKGTPTPTSAMQQLNLSSACSNESLRKAMHFDSQNSTPSSSYVGINSNFMTPQSSMGSPLDTFITPTDNQYKRDVKKMVVHPFSPDDLSLRRK